MLQVEQATIDAIVDSAERFARVKLRPVANESFHSDMNTRVLQTILASYGKRLDKTKLDRHAYIHSEVPVETVEEMGKMGFFGLTIPEKFKGLGLDYTTMARVTEILSGAWLGAGSIATRNQITATSILQNGTPEQQELWLPQLASGEMMTAIAVTEPDYGSDIANVATIATREGDEFVLTGSKMWCTYAHRANYLTVLARTGPGEGKNGLSLFLVEKPSKDVVEGQGISGSYIPTICYHGIPSFELRLDNVRVPLDNLVGGEEGIGKGFYYTLIGFQEGRLQTAARAIGVAKEAYEAALQYSKDRKQFGVPINTFQAVQHNLADMSTKLVAARSLVYAACNQMDKDYSSGRLLANQAKLFATDTADDVTGRAMEIFGAYGVARDYPIARLRADALLLGKFEGSNNVLRNMIAKDMLRST